jgi:predicted ATPase
MSQQPFLKSIRPVNLLSFGPNTEEIELSPLNILIGPNGCGKSNLIEIIRLLYFLPEKEPWAVVLDTGGVSEWIWKGGKGKSFRSSLDAKISLGSLPESHVLGTPLSLDFEYSIQLVEFQSSFRVIGEIVRTVPPADGGPSRYSWIESNGTQGEVHLRDAGPTDKPVFVALNPDKSVLSQVSSLPGQMPDIFFPLQELYEIGQFFDSLDFHQDWEFGVDQSARDPRPVGQPVARLEENAYNLAQMLAYYRDYHPSIYDRVQELMKQFYEPLKGLDIRLIGTHLQVAIQEEGGYSTPAYRLSDGTLRWLALVTILLNPSPAPVTCIDEPELGLHPDIIPTLADLLRDASTRTQLILTTHSRDLVECFSDDPGSVCVCEKIDGSTVIRRLDQERVKVWLKDYSLGQLWSSGQIGGNRW